jgi:hypothetical protein
MERLVSIEEAAKLLGGISTWTVHGWCSKGHPTYGRLQRTKVGNRTMLRESELERFIAVCNPQPDAIFPSSTGSHANPAGAA